MELKEFIEIYCKNCKIKIIIHKDSYYGDNLDNILCYDCFIKERRV